MLPAPRSSMAQAAILMVAMAVASCSSDPTTPIPGNDDPAITILEPGYAVEGDSAFQLFVHGQGFGITSVVRWNGANRVTSLQNPSPGVFVLRAEINSSDVVSPTTAEITVFNPDPGGGLSNSVDFRVYDPADLNPVPTISSVSPPNPAHAHDVTLTVNGTGFVSGATVTWKPAFTTNTYTETNVTFVNSTQLTVAIPAAHVTSGAATLKVVNPPPGGGTSGGEIVNVL